MHPLGSPPDPAMVEACQNAWESRWQRGASSLPGSGRDWGPAHADRGGQRRQSQRLLTPLPLTGLHFGRRTCGSKPAPSLALAGIRLRQATSLQAGLCKRGRAQRISMTAKHASLPLQQHSRRSHRRRRSGATSGVCYGARAQKHA